MARIQQEQGLLHGQDSTGNKECCTARVLPEHGMLHGKGSTGTRNAARQGFYRNTESCMARIQQEQELLHGQGSRKLLYLQHCSTVPAIGKTFTLVCMYPYIMARVSCNK
jgi:hypothetical protein